jgi:hypothetical protein
MNQAQLNRLWLAEGGSESLRAIGVTGLTGTVVFNSRILQTMLVVYSNTRGQKLNTTTYVRKREVPGVDWELWRSCGE